MKKLSYLLVISLAFCAAFPAFAQQETKPKLAVVLVIDQMRPDFLTRFNQYYTGGFRRLIDHGFVFDSATHDHACTETGPGHATIGTGRIPAKNGIIANEWFDRTGNTSMYCVGDTSVHIVGYPDDAGVSPKNIVTDGLGDWLKKANPNSKVVSLSLKDRAAVGMGGKHPNAAVWWNRNTGDFVTSTYYADSLPSWVAFFNKQHTFDTLQYRLWKKTFPDSCYLLSTFDSFPGENNGPDLQNSFPHELTYNPDKPSAFYKTFLYVSPFADEGLLNLAQMAVRVEQLGADSIPDLLCISLSSSDAIGHTFGPNSQEAEDYYLRIDQKLGDFFTALDTLVGANAYTVVLSADHGVLPLPEFLDMYGVPSERILSTTIESDFNAITSRMESEGVGKAAWFKGSPQEIYLMPDTVITDSLKSAILNRLKQELVVLPYVDDAFTQKELTSGKAKDRPYFQQYKNSLYTPRFSDMIIRYKENLLPFASQYGTSHGTPYYYDRHVPLLFYGANIPAGVNYEPVRTVDLAATVADELHVAVPADADGVSLLKKMQNH